MTDYLRDPNALHPTDEAAYEWTGVDDDLPGMWSHSDFLGGDPDERSYAQREADAAADAVSLDRVAPCSGYEASDERFEQNRIAVRRHPAYDDAWLVRAVPASFADLPAEGQE